MIGSPVNEGIAGDKKSYYEYEEVFNMKKLISMVVAIALVIGAFAATINFYPAQAATCELDVRVNGYYDDAEEDADTGDMSLGSTDLELGQEDSSTYQFVGMRFNNVSIPQGANVTSAYVQFHVDETGNIDPVMLNVRGEKVADAAAFSSSDFNISNRLLTGAGAIWQPPQWTVKHAEGPDQRTPLIHWTIEEIVGQSGWSSGNSLVIIISGVGKRVAESYNGEPENAPLLHVEYDCGGDPTSTPTPTDPAPTPTPTDPGPTPPPAGNEFRVVASSDDSEEHEDGRIEGLSSSDLELIREDDDQTVGMRFQNVTIPQGATILFAYIQFMVDETNNIDPCVLTIKGEKVANSSTFTTSYYDITSRPTTSAAVNWQPPPWDTVGEAGPDQRTPDLTGIISEIVGQPTWTSGNALSIIISGDGKRVAESFDGSGQEPILNVYYGGGGGEPTPTPTDPAPTPTPTPSDPYQQLIIPDESGTGGVSWSQWYKNYYETSGWPAEFADDFNRSDANNLGNGWDEVETGTHKIKLEDQQMLWVSHDGTNLPQVSHSFLDGYLNEPANIYLRDLVMLQFDWEGYYVGPQGNLPPDTDYQLHIQLGQGSLMQPVTQDMWAGVAAHLFMRPAMSDGTDETFHMGYAWDGNQPYWYELGQCNGLDLHCRIMIELTLPYKYARANGYEHGISGGGNIFHRPKFGWEAGQDIAFPWIDDSITEVDTVRIWMHNFETDSWGDEYIDNYEVRLGDAILSGGTNPPTYTTHLRLRAPEINPLRGTRTGCDEGTSPGSCNYAHGVDQTFIGDLTGLGFQLENLYQFWCPDTHPNVEPWILDMHLSCDPRYPPEECYMQNYHYGYRDTTTCAGDFFSMGLSVLNNPDDPVGCSIGGDYWRTENKAYNGGVRIYEVDSYFDPLTPRACNDVNGRSGWENFPPWDARDFLP
jgi:hypothetical protein